jgi:hypothetical protein
VQQSPSPSWATRDLLGAERFGSARAVEVGRNARLLSVSFSFSVPFPNVPDPGSPSLSDGPGNPSVNIVDLEALNADLAALVCE